MFKEKFHSPVNAPDVSGEFVAQFFETIFLTAKFSGEFE
jgi:hypothetical protein